MAAKNKMNKKITALIAAAVIVVLFAAVFFITGTGAVSNEDEETIVTIESGSGSYQIIDALDEAGLIKNKTVAKVYIMIFAPDNLQANTYVLNKNMDLKTMIEIISTGDFEHLLKTKFTIIEGSTIPDAAENIAEALGFEKEDVLKVWSDKAFLKELIDEYWFLTEDILDSDIMFPLEGYLYPETYFVVDQEPTVESVTRHCLDIMNENLTPLKEQIESMNMSIHEFVTLASVVEAESLYAEDYSAIAGVFFNRLVAVMPLQSDITVLYALQEKRVDVTLNDLEVDSKYNTYKYAGLPVGPVCTVRAEILDACVNYEKHDYLYFFATETGKVIYNKTLAEHNATVSENLWY